MKKLITWKSQLGVWLALGVFGLLVFMLGSIKVDDKYISIILNNNGFKELELTGYDSLYKCPFLERRNYARSFRAVSEQGQAVRGFVCHTLSGSATIQQEWPVKRTIKVNHWQEFLLDSPSVKP